MTTGRKVRGLWTARAAAALRAMRIEIDSNAATITIKDKGRRLENIKHEILMR